MKNLPIQKIIALFKSLQGKSKVLIATVALVFVLGALAIQLGYVTGDLLHYDGLIEFLDQLVKSDVSVTDSVVVPIDLGDTIINATMEAPADSLEALVPLVSDSVSIK